MKRLTGMQNNIECFNLGTGEGYSVFDVLKGFEKALGGPIKTNITPRRCGDVPKLLANIDKASHVLGWKVTKSLNQMCEDSVNFIQKRYKEKADKNK